ncbi:hypothetical protein BC833DRAFT_564265 [Globomyces pollinis-pini]|nr:hypothetical protein BC833DRAFT_564265 [Globomyces pollinis-pini]KAJ2998589.1 hypothetical protein HDV02_004404 [Globomyces sp. JEL0801]
MEDLEKKMQNDCDKLEMDTIKVMELLSKLFDSPIETHLTKLTQLGKSNLLVTLAFAINTLSFVLLKINAVNPKNHPVKQELDRCKEYYEKISKMSNNDKRKLTVDQGAAKRFISHALLANPEMKEHIQTERANHQYLDERANDIDVQATEKEEGNDSKKSKALKGQTQSNQVSKKKKKITKK